MVTTSNQFGQTENPRGQQSKCQKELVKVLTLKLCGCSHDYRV